MTIAAPNALHCRMTCDAARAGKHVVCEKPLAMSLAEADEMIAECRCAGVPLMDAEERVQSIPRAASMAMSEPCRAGGDLLWPRICNASSVSMWPSRTMGRGALGEIAWGAGHGSRSLILVTIGTGIGAGIVLGGQLYRGACGAHPEIGRRVLDPGGAACYCGANDCWEPLASGPAMERWMSTRVGRKLSAGQICELARQADPPSVHAVERTAHYLGLGLANLVTMFCPQTIVLAGGMVQSADLLPAPAVDTNTSIVLAGLGPRSGLLGAAGVWFHRAC